MNNSFIIMDTIIEDFQIQDSPNQQQQQPQKRRKITNQTFQSGAAEGADAEFHKEAKKAGHRIANYIFQGQSSEIKENLVILSENVLKLADESVKKASQHLGRSVGSKKYVRNLLRRNYFQIRDTSSVFAISDFDENGKNAFNVGIQGGTAWACQMFANNQRDSNRRGLIPLFLYAQTKSSWFQCFILEINGEITWTLLESIPKLPSDGNYTGIGSRHLTTQGKQAIQQLYENLKLN